MEVSGVRSSWRDGGDELILDHVDLAQPVVQLRERLTFGFCLRAAGA